MTTANRPILALTAADLMSATVITIPHDMSLRGAARLLAQANVSGAPVVDAVGRCIGVLSARDFVGWAERGGPASRRDGGTGDCFCTAWQVMDDDALPTDVVARFMTADPVTAEPTTPIGTAAQMMIDARIHRIIVLDRRDRPVGIVSSTDILAAVARAAQSHGADAVEDHDHASLDSRAP